MNSHNETCPFDRAKVELTSVSNGVPIGTSIHLIRSQSHENILSHEFKEKSIMSLMEVPYIGSTKQAAEIKDASGEITINLWKFQIRSLENHPTFQVDVDIGPSEDWGSASEVINIYSNVKGGIMVLLSPLGLQQWM